jgi:23S rRNA (guanine2445-N2)-methyltransferase / 23S rRNA (guanine2069-N7)-methyltransferase
MARRLALYATAARGTEALLAEELEALGVTRIRQDRGGVRFHASIDEALGVCVHSRIAMRVLYPLAEGEARDAQEVYDRARDVAWEEHLTVESTFAVEATLRAGETGHSGFLALKIKDAIVDRLREKLGARPDVDTRHPDVQVVAHLGREKLSLSLDLCGEPLHKRGYRIRTTPAPMKETLAAAILRAVKYSGDEALLDPMCGSGTLLIEAGLIATRRPPGLDRAFAAERWPHHGKAAREALTWIREDAKKHLRDAPALIWGLDKSDEAVDAARRNVAKAGLGRFIRVEVGDATAPPPLPEGQGLIVSNPPYGDRLGGGQKGMKTFYFQLGESLGGNPGWRMAMLSGNAAFESAFHHRPKSRLPLWNGPIECTLLEYPAAP